MNRRRPIDIEGFDAKFRDSGDPWQTFSSRDEAIKRERILNALGKTPVARVLELGSGNGSNSRALARRSLRLDACEATPHGAGLTREALADEPGARVFERVLPAAFPGRSYNTVVIAELLYYLSERDLRRLARDVARVLTRSGRIVLAHHHIEFPDNAQRAADIHARFLAATGLQWRRRYRARSRLWQVAAFTRERAG